VVQASEQLHIPERLKKGTDFYSEPDIRMRVTGSFGLHLA
jgi:hypothetical protein